MNKDLRIDAHGRLRLTINDFLGKNVNVLGLKGYGKSNTAAVLAEEFLEAGVPVCIIDIKGEYWGLKEKHKIFVVGRTVNVEPEAIDARISASSARRAAINSYTKAVSVILDVSGFTLAEREDFLSVYFQTLWDISGTPKHRHPYMIFIDEAMEFVPQGANTSIKSLMIDITCLGRSRGFGVVVIGQRAALIDKTVLTMGDMFFFHYTSFDVDVDRYTSQMAMAKPRAREAIRKLKKGECLLVQNEMTTWYKIRLRDTSHKAHTPTMDDLPQERGVDTVQGLLL